MPKDDPFTEFVSAEGEAFVEREKSVSRVTNIFIVSVASLLLLLTGCDEGSDSASPAPGEPEITVGEDAEDTPEDAVINEEPEPRIEKNWKDAWDPAEPVLRRLTREQYGNVLRDVFGPELVVPTSLEPDNRNSGLMAVGASVNALSPVGAEKYFAAAKSVAKQLVSQAQLKTEHVACADGENQADEACLENTLSTYGKSFGAALSSIRKKRNCWPLRLPLNKRSSRFYPDWRRFSQPF